MSDIFVFLGCIAALAFAIAVATAD